MSTNSTSHTQRRASKRGPARESAELLYDRVDAAVAEIYARAGMNPDEPNIGQLAVGLFGVANVLPGGESVLGEDHAVLVFERDGLGLRYRLGESPFVLGIAFAREIACCYAMETGAARIDELPAAILIPAPAVRRFVAAGFSHDEIAHRCKAHIEVVQQRIRIVGSPDASGEFPSIRAELAEHFVEGRGYMAPRLRVLSGANGGLAK